jgi:hypothetical protein
MKTHGKHAGHTAQEESQVILGIHTSEISIFSLLSGFSFIFLSLYLTQDHVSRGIGSRIFLSCLLLGFTGFTTTLAMYQFATLRYLKTHGELVDNFLTIPFRRLTIIVATSATGLTMTAIAVLLVIDHFYIEAAVFMAINMPCLFLMCKIYMLHQKKKEQ